jgi:hypothetical protein
MSTQLVAKKAKMCSYDVVTGTFTNKDSLLIGEEIIEFSVITQYLQEKYSELFVASGSVERQGLFMKIEGDFYVQVLKAGDSVDDFLLRLNKDYTRPSPVLNPDASRASTVLSPDASRASTVSSPDAATASIVSSPDAAAASTRSTSESWSTVARRASVIPSSTQPASPKPILRNSRGRGPVRNASKFPGVSDSVIDAKDDVEHTIYIVAMDTVKTSKDDPDYFNGKGSVELQNRIFDAATVMKMNTETPEQADLWRKLSPEEKMNKVCEIFVNNHGHDYQLWREREKVLNSMNIPGKTVMFNWLVGLPQNGSPVRKQTYDWGNDLPFLLASQRIYDETDGEFELTLDLKKNKQNGDLIIIKLVKLT